MAVTLLLGRIHHAGRVALKNFEHSDPIYVEISFVNMRGEIMYKYFFIVVILVLLPVMAQGQQSDDATRDLWDTAFIQKRPPAKSPVKRAAPIRYRSVSKSRVSPAPNQSAVASAVVGVTVWRLRPSRKTDDEEVRQLVHREGEWTPERVGGGTPLAEGSKVQLTIESPRSGYLYVFNREVFADGTFGDPYLIFPTLNINDGDNKVRAGRMIEIPSAEDKPPYYTLRRSRDDHQGESLTVIVSDKPLPDVVIGRRALKILPEQFLAYETQWGGMTEQLELESGAGTAMSKAERAAASGRSALTPDDAPPQTIYRIMSKPNQPLLVTIPLSLEARP